LIAWVRSALLLARDGETGRAEEVLMLLIRSTYTTMSGPSKDELRDRETSFVDDTRSPVAAQPGSGEKADVETHAAHVNADTSKEHEIKPCKTSSTVSLDQRSTHDEEKGLPVGPQTEKEPAVTDAEHDPNIVDWDGEADPENPLNWSAKKKWYANSVQ